MTRAVLALCVCAVTWFAIYRMHARINPMFKLEDRSFRVRFAVLVLLAFVFVLATRCRPYAEAQAAEKPECEDVALALIVAECTAAIKAEPNVTKKNTMRRDCLERVDAWEKCQ